MEVELLSVYGSDQDIVNVARVSYQKEANNYTQEQNNKLIKYLADHGHTSPFYHAQLQFRVKCPIYVERQLFKHHIGVSVNSISGRYVDFSDTYTKIDKWRYQSKSSKQGSAGDLPMDAQIAASTIQNEVIDTCKKAYEDLINLGISKEQARSVLPLNLNTEFIWTGSLYAFINMCHKRLDPHAQKETRDVVKKMLDLAKKKENFKITFESFNL